MDDQPTFNSSLTLEQQRNLWRTQASGTPDLKAAKERMFHGVIELLNAIHSAGSVSLDDEAPSLSDGHSRIWRDYSSPLRTMALVVNKKGYLELSEEGQNLRSCKDPEVLGDLLAARVRLFAESLCVVAQEPRTVSEVHEIITQSFRLSWKSEGNVRIRLTWLEVMGFIEWLGGRKLAATDLGRRALSRWNLVTPESRRQEKVPVDVRIPEAPQEVSRALDRLRDDPTLHAVRKTYNVWVPSPASDPSKVENLRICIAAASDPTDKEELLSFIAERFGLRRSSVDSMLPFMRAAGFLHEVRRGVFSATPLAKTWLASSADVDFIRILHLHYRFVGELLDFSRDERWRNDVYIASVAHGLNKEKTRWLISFLVDAGVLTETAYMRVQASPLGLALLPELPLWDAPGRVAEAPSEVVSKVEGSPGVESGGGRVESSVSRLRTIAQRLSASSIDPRAEMMASGAAFEAAVEEAFRAVGFNAQRISGSGNTDVLVQWYTEEGDLKAAIVDAKSTSGGSVSHTQVSDLAISRHKSKHDAEFVALVAPEFSGETIREMAKKNQWVLITAHELSEMIQACVALGVASTEFATVFQSPDGPSKVLDLMESRRRELDLISLVVARLSEESENGEAFSARDISLIERSSESAPTIEEIVAALAFLQSLGLDVVRPVETTGNDRFDSYRIGDPASAANRLRALADAIDEPFIRALDR